MILFRDRRTKRYCSVDFACEGLLRTALPRHQTLRATFDWSHALLGCNERALFRRSAIFDGTFTFDELCIVACDATFTVESARMSPFP